MQMYLGTVTKTRAQAAQPKGTLSRFECSRWRDGLLAANQQLSPAFSGNCASRLLPRSDRGICARGQNFHLLVGRRLATCCHVYVHALPLSANFQMFNIARETCVPTIKATRGGWEEHDPRNPLRSSSCQCRSRSCLVAPRARHTALLHRS